MAYFLPSRRVFEALRAAAARGVRVRILLQGPSDHAVLKYASQFLYRRLIASNVEVFEYHRSFLHTKVAVADLEWSTVGSSNLDPFSLLLSREANVEILDAPFARSLADSVERAIAEGARQTTVADLARMRWYSRALQWASYRFARGMVDWLNLA
jgi:cardiolipin synthase